MKKRYTLRILLCAACLLTVTPILAQDAGDIPQITIEATAEGFTVPAEMPEGVVQVTFANNSETPIIPVIARLNEGVTPEALAAAAAEQGEQAALALVSVLGGAGAAVMPEMTVDVIFDFRSSPYKLLVGTGTSVRSSRVDQI